MRADHPKIFSSFKNLVVAQSTRQGGVSPVPFKSLNMGFSSGDTEENVLTNRELFFSSIGIRSENVAWSGQVHGKEILLADKGGKNSGYDALITNSKNVFVAVGVADCCPVLIYDAKQKAVAAVHAGWRGTVQNIVSLTLKKMKEEFGTEGKNCFAYIGTCISECSFEVGEEVAAEFDRSFARYDELRKKYFVDLKNANKKQLTDFGVPDNQIEVSPYCTVLHNENYFSYRKEGKESGRMLAVIGMKDE
jgi:polyphenol oxidase